MENRLTKDELIKKHWNLVKDNVGKDGLMYKNRRTKEEHKIFFTEKVPYWYLKGIIHGLENGYIWSPA